MRRGYIVLGREAAVWIELLVLLILVIGWIGAESGGDRLFRLHQEGNRKWERIHGERLSQD